MSGSTRGVEKLLHDMPTVLASQVFNKKFLKVNKIRRSQKLVVVSGKDLSPEMFGAEFACIECQKYTYFCPLASEGNNSKSSLQQPKHYFRCEFGKCASNEGCYKNWSSPVSFFEHFSSHIGVSLYTCPYPDCHRAIRQRRNLVRHM